MLIMRAITSPVATQRDTVLVPDSAITNPASTSMSGLRVVQIPSDGRGNVDLDALRSQVCDRVVGLITNPNTLGLLRKTSRKSSTSCTVVGDWLWRWSQYERPHRCVAP